jgi:CheY-like chemotaxis protein
MPYRNLRVLVVEDDADLAELYSAAFNQLGIQSVVQCSNGIDAQKQLSEGRFDIIILDYHIPGKTGLQLLSTIASDSKNSSAKRYFISGFLTPRVEQEIRTFRVNRVFPKPFDLKDFSAAVAEDLCLDEHPSEIQSHVYQTFKKVLDDKFSKLDKGFVSYPGVFHQGVMVKDYYRALIPLFGTEVYGSIALNISRNGVLKYLNSILESPSSVDQDLVIDSVCELTNQLAGELKLQLSEAKVGRIRLGLPIADKHCQVSHPVVARVLSHTCELFGGGMFAEIAIGRD